MTTIILSLILACVVILAAVLSLRNEFINGKLNEAYLEIEELEKSLEMSNALRQLLRNEVKVLNAQISKSNQPPVVEEVKKKKKYFRKKPAPKMSANKPEQE
jgi:hypothetical protein